MTVTASSRPPLCKCKTPRRMSSVLAARTPVCRVFFLAASSPAGHPGTLGGASWPRPTSPPPSIDVSAEIPLFKGEIISFCSIGLDQRQSLSGKTKPSYAGGSRPLYFTSRERDGVFYSFSRTGNSHALETPAAELKCFPKTNIPIMKGTGLWQPPPNCGGQVGTGPPCLVEGEQTIPLSAVHGVRTGRHSQEVLLEAHSPSVKACFLHLVHS